MTVEFPKNPEHKQIYTDKNGLNYIYNNKTKKWYTFTEENAKELKNKSKLRWWHIAVGIFLLIFSALYIIGINLENTAKEAGFASYDDYLEAEKYGIKDNKIWLVKKAEIIAEQKAQTLKLEKEKAKNAGFSSVKEFTQAIAKGFSTKTEWDKHLKTENFFKKPTRQLEFLEATYASRDRFNSATNDLAKGSSRNYRKLITCRVLKNNIRANGWVGKIELLSSNGDGWGVLSIKIGKNVYLKTTNNSLSNIYSKTLISPNSTLFKDLSKLQVGDRIKFSGQFIRDETKTDCISEQSITLSGSMTEPEYIFRFSKLHGQPKF